MRLSLVGAVESTEVALGALLDRGYDPLVLTLPPRLGARHSDYVDLAERHRAHRDRIVEIDRIATPDVVHRLEAEAPDVLLVFGWSQLCPPQITSIARHATLGCHPSALPRNRGRAVIPWTILQGATETAMSLFHLVDEVDAGDVVVQVPIPVAPRETARSLYDKQLAALREALGAVLDTLERGDALPRWPQDRTAATWCARRDREDGRIDFRRPAADVDRLIRASAHPYPGAFTTHPASTVRVWAAHDGDACRHAARPGQIIGVEQTGITVMCGDARAIVLDEWELEGSATARLRLHEQLGIRT
jgi:methionyl-tRNA formyltransferase